LGQTIATFKLNPNLYELGETINSSQYALAIPTTTLNKVDLWHLRLGHINHQRLKQIQIVLKDIEPIDEKQITLCQTCKEGKQHKENFLNKLQDKLLKYLN